MLAVFVFQDNGYGKGTCFATKEELFHHLLFTYGPDCRLQDGVWFGGCNSPDEGWGRIIGFKSDREFNSEFQQYVEDYCGHNINCSQCNLPEHSCCCGGCVETH